MGAILKNLRMKKLRIGDVSPACPFAHGHEEGHGTRHEKKLNAPFTFTGYPV
jgi:hypothetical protein